jgi:hypothetical protein
VDDVAITSGMDFVGADCRDHCSLVGAFLANDRNTSIERIAELSWP